MASILNIIACYHINLGLLQLTARVFHESKSKSTQILYIKPNLCSIVDQCNPADYLNQGNTGLAHSIITETMSGAGSSAKASGPKPLDKTVSLPAQALTGPGSVASEAFSGPMEWSGLMTVTPKGESSKSTGGSSEWGAARKC
jgi:hypothetical protein